MSSNVAEAASVDALEELRVPPRALRSGTVGAILVALAPALAALAALAVHGFVPDDPTISEEPAVSKSWMDDLPGWQHPYPVLLEALIVLAPLMAAAQWGWRPLRPWVRHYAPLLAGGTIAACLWEAITIKLAWMPQPYFPGPDQILGALIDDRVMLAESTWHSLRLLLCGYVLGVSAGLVTGVSIGWFAHVRYWGMPVLKLIGPIPATALVALAMTVFPASLKFFSAAALIGFAVWFPVTMLTASGISNVRVAYLDVARTLGAGRLYLIFRVAVPSALPNVFIGLFMGLGASFLTLIVAETVGVKAGLGWYLQWQKGYADYAKVYASLVIMSVFFSTLMTFLFLVRDRVLKWQKGVIKW